MRTLSCLSAALLSPSTNHKKPRNIFDASILSGFKKWEKRIRCLGAEGSAQPVDDLPPAATFCSRPKPSRLEIKIFIRLSKWWLLVQSQVQSHEYLFRNSRVHQRRVCRTTFSRQKLRLSVSNTFGSSVWRCLSSNEQVAPFGDDSGSRDAYIYVYICLHTSPLSSSLLLPSTPTYLLRPTQGIKHQSAHPGCLEVGSGKVAVPKLCRLLKSLCIRHKLF